MICMHMGALQLCCASERSDDCAPEKQEQKKYNEFGLCLLCALGCAEALQHLLLGCQMTVRMKKFENNSSKDVRAIGSNLDTLQVCCIGFQDNRLVQGEPLHTS